MATLTHKRPDGTSRVLEFGSKPLVVGRLPESDISVRDSFISRVHCGVSWAGSQFTLKDLGSTNGTYRNGARVFECQLASGDKIQVGNTTLIFEVAPDTGNAELRQVPQLAAGPRIAPPATPLGAEVRNATMPVKAAAPAPPR